MNSLMLMHSFIMSILNHRGISSCFRYRTTHTCDVPFVSSKENLQCFTLKHIARPVRATTEGKRKPRVEKEKYACVKVFLFFFQFVFSFRHDRLEK